MRRTRGPATGITAACNYLFVFTATKTYLSLEQTFALSGSFLCYGLFGVIGYGFDNSEIFLNNDALLIVSFIVHFFVFPETEGRTLEEIEMYFSDTGRSLFDRNIRRLATTESASSEVAQSIELQTR